MATLIKLAVYLVEDVQELVSQNFYRYPKMIHPYPVGQYRLITPPI